MDGVLPNKLPAPGRRFAASVKRAQGYLLIVHVEYPGDCQPPETEVSERARLDT